MKKKMLGIDYGEKRVGVAISDDDRKMAFPKYVLQNDNRLIEKILKICENENVNEIVLGRSLDYRNQPNIIMKNIEEFGKNLGKEKGLKVYFENEFLTTAEARRLQGENEMIDASAAALILKSYMEKI